MALPILFYILAGALFGGAVALTLSSFYDGIKSWVKNSFNYLVTEIHIVVDRFWVGVKRKLQIKATTQRGHVIETEEDVDINKLPPEIKAKVEHGVRYQAELLLTN